MLDVLISALLTLKASHLKSNDPAARIAASTAGSSTQGE